MLCPRCHQWCARLSHISPFGGLEIRGSGECRWLTSDPRAGYAREAHQKHPTGCELRERFPQGIHNLPTISTAVQKTDSTQPQDEGYARLSASGKCFAAPEGLFHRGCATERSFGPPCPEGARRAQRMLEVGFWIRSRQL